jgi:hypothetical protein
LLFHTVLVQIDPHVFHPSTRDGVNAIVVLPNEAYQSNKQIKRLVRIVLQVHSTMPLPEQVEVCVCVCVCTSTHIYICACVCVCVQDGLADQIKKGIQRAEERLSTNEGKEDKSYLMDYIPVCVCVCICVCV